MALGPSRMRGIGDTARYRAVSAIQAPPTNPGNGSGGPGILRGLAQGDTGRLAGVNLSPALGEVSAAKSGRITLGMVNLTILAMLGFYWWTRSAQGGG